MKRVGSKYVETTYEEAVDEISSKLTAIIKEHGPHAVSGYLGNPGGFSFGAGSFFNLLIDGIGSRNKFYTGSIDQNALNVVFENMFGSGWLALQRDVEECKCFMLIGTNPAISAFNWQGHVADGWRRLLAAKENGAELIVVDPRRTETAAKASVHVSPLPETDWALLLGIIKIVYERSWDRSRYTDRINGLDTIRNIATACDINELALRCDVPVSIIENVAELFATSPTAMALTATGPGQGRNGTLSIWLAVVLNLITDRIEVPGGLYFAKDVLLNLMELSDELMPSAVKVSRVRGSTSILGFLPIAEIPDEINTPGEGQIRAMLIHGGNPVVTGPNGKELSKALDSLELLVCCDLFQRDTHQNADWLIPAIHMLEREELHMLIHSLNPAPWGQMSRQVVPPPVGMLPEWVFYRDLALAMDVPLIKGKRFMNLAVRFGRFLSGVTGNLDHSFSPRLMSWMLMKKSTSLKWKDIVNSEHGIGNSNRKIEFGSVFDYLKTADGKVQAAPQSFLDLLQVRLQEPVKRTTEHQFPLQIITRRSMYLMNSWSHETSASKLKKPLGDSIELNPIDCERFGITDGQNVKVISESSELITRVKCSDAVRPGVATMAHGWGGKTFDPKNGSYAENGGVNRNLLVSNSEVDPLSYVPRLNGCEVRIETLESGEQGLVA